jgi:hypothetical protein
MVGVGQWRLLLPCRACAERFIKSWILEHTHRQHRHTNFTQYLYSKETNMKLTAAIILLASSSASGEATYEPGNFSDGNKIEQ